MPSAFLCRINFTCSDFFMRRPQFSRFVNIYLKMTERIYVFGESDRQMPFAHTSARRKKVGGLKKQTAEHKERRQENFSENRSIGVLMRF